MENKKLPVYGLSPFTMLDYPDKTACIIWFAGCNMRCAYCHNPNIVLGGKGTMPITDIWKFLEKRKGLLNAVVLSGGESTLYPDIEEVAKKAKKMGFDVKLDTNGSKPKTVKKLLEKNLIDYIALDYKSTFEKYKKVTGSNHYEKFSETLNYLCKTNSIPFEVRITVHTNLLNESDINLILEDLKNRNYKNTCYIQNYTHTETIKNLPEQEKILDITKFKTNYPFKIEFRNF